MFVRRCLICAAAAGCLLAGVAGLAGEPDPKLPPIQRLKGPRPSQAVFKASSAKKPLVIETAEEAAKWFSEKALAELREKVDFAQQKLLVFAWRGSGGDRLTYSVAESYPEQVFFKLHRGRTRDLRAHLSMYALRANVRWSVR